MSTKLLITLLSLLGILFILAACSQNTSDISGTDGMGEMEGHESASMDKADHEMTMADGMVAELESLTGSEFEVAFMDAMIPHHQSAIEMAQIALERSQRPELKVAAQAIIDAQQKEITEMKGWLQEWHSKAPSGMDHGMAMEAEMEALRTVPANEFDVAFLRAMIPHHDGAIQMAELVAERNTRPELNAMAEAIISSQRTENQQFEQWIKEWSSGS